jgi:plasmid stabilization system protein ParE
MTFRVVIEAAAMEDATEHAVYIADQGLPDTALEWVDRFNTATASLSEMPTRCPVAREHEFFTFREELRQLLFGSHRIIFTIRGGVVHVLRGRHAAQRNLTSEELRW